LAHFFVRLITVSNVDNFSNIFSLSELGEIILLLIDPTTPQMCRYTTLWNVDVLKQQLKTRLL